jgi:hypothetical protein
LLANGAGVADFYVIWVDSSAAISFTIVGIACLSYSLLLLVLRHHVISAHCSDFLRREASIVVSATVTAGSLGPFHIIQASASEAAPLLACTREVSSCLLRTERLSTYNSVI